MNINTKKAIKEIRANESLGYLYTEEEVINSFGLSINQLIENSINHFVFSSAIGQDVNTLTYDFSGKEIITIHIIIDYITGFIKENIRKTVKESDLVNRNIKIEQLIKECIHYEILEVNEDRVMVLTFKGFGILGVILEKE